MKTFNKTILAASLASAMAWAMPSAALASEANIDCHLDYTITGWSAIYKHSEGSGVVNCNDGSTMRVNISAKGVGLTAGKWKIDNGHGRFSDVHHIGEVIGDYAHAEAHAGVVKSGSTQVLSKGSVSLALAGTGEGVDLGIDVGEFTLSPAD